MNKKISQLRRLLTENNIDYVRDGNNFKLSNWWDLFFNWDNAIINDKTLWE